MIWLETILQGLIEFFSGSLLMKLTRKKKVKKAKKPER